MTQSTLTLWGNGSVTLPKEWREKYGTKHYLAHENQEGHLVIVPIVDAMYYESEDGTCGLKFPGGIEASKLKEVFEEAMTTMEPKSRKTKKRVSPKA